MSINYRKGFSKVYTKNAPFYFIDLSLLHQVFPPFILIITLTKSFQQLKSSPEFMTFWHIATHSSSYWKKYILDRKTNTYLSVALTSWPCMSEQHVFYCKKDYKVSFPTFKASKAAAKAFSQLLQSLHLSFLLPWHQQIWDGTSVSPLGRRSRCWDSWIPLCWRPLHIRPYKKGRIIKEVGFQKVPWN